MSKTSNVTSVIKIKIQNCKDRENIIVGLANAGIKCWVEVERATSRNNYNSSCYVLFEYQEAPK